MKPVSRARAREIYKAKKAEDARLAKEKAAQEKEEKRLAKEKEKQDKADKKAAKKQAKKDEVKKDGKSKGEEIGDGWHAYKAKAGQPYYWNEFTGVSTWHHPKVHDMKFPQQDASPVGPGYSEDDDGYDTPSIG